MQTPEIHLLKQALLEAYETFADKRIKNIDRGQRFIVDLRTSNDIASDGSPYGWFCSMFLDVNDAHNVTLRIINIPSSPSVADWLEKNARPAGQFAYQATFSKGEEVKLLDLARSVDAITARGRRYDVPSYKYAVPRVVEALQVLYRALASGWQAHG
ncbi:hypothetical protein [Novosphingobium sp.]|uniref:hypothetical protein n=1 Tax=Novosphingobium sp. TaxID=1874826 RepID=UPI0031D34349